MDSPTRPDALCLVSYEEFFGAGLGNGGVDFRSLSKEVAGVK